MTDDSGLLLLPPASIDFIDLCSDDDDDPVQVTTFAAPQTASPPTPTSSRPRSLKRKAANPATVGPSPVRYSLRSHFSPVSTPSTSVAVAASLPAPVDVEQLSASDLFLFPESSSITSELRTSDDCQITFIARFLSPLAIRLLHAELEVITTWQTGTLHGHPIPRVSCWFASSTYKYAAKNWPNFPHPPFLLRLQSLLTQHVRAHIDPAVRPFMGCLVNKYRNGNDSMGAHADDEGPLGPRPTIASINIGTTRTFCMARKAKPVDGGRRRPLKFELVAGCVLLMAGETQTHWVHSVPKQPDRIGTRYNLTFRPWRGEE